MQKNKTVLVIGLNGCGLMPCTPRKARILLTEKKAKVVRRSPFTIRLLYKTGCSTQPTTLGVDTGSQHIGIAIVSDDTVLAKSEYELRSTMEKRKLMEIRKQYRRSRRYRKTRYRHPKFWFHTKRTYVEKPIKRNDHMTHWKKETVSCMSNRPAGWLPPSVQSKCDHHIRIISRYIEALPPSTRAVIEIGRFDMAHMLNPAAHGEEYQHGPQYEFENKKAYLLKLYDYKCPICGKKFGSVRTDGITVKARLHHVLYRSKGSTNNANVLIPICNHCHTAEAHQGGGTLDKLRKIAEKQQLGIRGLRDATMMNVVAKHIQAAFPDAYYTYGNITKADRDEMCLEKSHANDAVAIAKHLDIRAFRNYTISDCGYTTLYKQVRKKKRSLHEANPRKGRKQPNRTAKRNAKNTKRVKNVCLLDKVVYQHNVGIVIGFSNSSCRAVKADGSYLGANVKYKQPVLPVGQVEVLHHNNNWMEMRLVI